MLATPPVRRAPRPGRAAVVAALALVVVGCAGDGVLDDVARDGTSTMTSSTTSTTTPSTTTTSTTTTTTTTIPPDFSLAEGAQGEQVWQLEQDLLAAGYWLPGADDGVYDVHTLHAVTAVQKVHGLPRTGVADRDTVLALRTGPRPTPRSTSGHVIEVDLERQVTFVVRDGVVTEIFDVSTGRRSGWTPVGEHAITREIDGIRNAPLGRLYRPKYFVGGVAFHGYPQVPPEPASHGCVRVTNAVMDHIWETDLMPKGTPVLVY